MPLVSVIMPVYNAELYVCETIDSILSQTMKDFEFLIIDDASIDNSWNLIKSYTDQRIRAFRNETNLGYVTTLNKLLDIADGKYVARQDNDDISLPNRLKMQVGFLDLNPNVGVCGTFAYYFGSRTEKITKLYRSEDIKANLIFANQIIHPSVLMRNSIFKGENALRYKKDLCPAEDYALWFEISKNQEIANLRIPLLRYRWHENNVSQLKENDQIDKANLVRHMILENTLSIKLTDKEKQIHNFLSRPAMLELEDLDLLETWLINLEKINRECKYYNEKSLQQAIFENWSYTCRNNLKITSLKILNRYYRSDIVRINSFLFKSVVKTTLKNLYRQIK